MCRNGGLPSVLTMTNTKNAVITGASRGLGLALARGLAAEGPSPSQLASEREAAVRLADALARLPDDYRDVLLLRIFEELPAEEVAQRMNRSAGAVRMLQMRALQALREVMGGEERG